MAAPKNLSGVWTYGVTAGADWDSEPLKGPGEATPAVLLHGTVVRQPYFLITMSAHGDSALGIVEIFDEDACFARFIWDDDSGAWVSDSSAHDFTIKAGSYLVQMAYSLSPAEDQNHPFTPDAPSTFKVTTDVPIVRYPTLQLATATVGSSSRAVGDPYVISAGLGDKKVERPKETLTFETYQRLKWSSSVATVYLELCGTIPSAAEEPPPASQQFGERFHDDSHYAQMTWPFMGFNPLKMDLYGAGGNFTSTTGTTVDQYPISNPKQEFTGRLLFKFPLYNSTKYVRALDVPGKPFIPFGTWTQADIQTASATSSHVFESKAERTHSQSASFGLNGGIEGLFNFSGENKTSKETENKTQAEWRYSDVVEVMRQWAYRQYLPGLELKEEFIEQIQECCKALLAGQDPDWAGLVRDFGSHYFHASAQGFLKVTRTYFSLDLESKLVKKGDTLKVATDLTYAGMKGGGSLEMANSWSSLYGASKSEEFTVFHALGDAANLTTIALDLRPITELLNPILFRQAPLFEVDPGVKPPYYGSDIRDQWNEFAPLVWFNLRNSFSNWLLAHGLDMPVDLNGPADLAPIKWKAELTGIELTCYGRSGFNGMSFDNSTPATLAIEPPSAGCVPAYIELGNGSDTTFPEAPSYGAPSAKQLLFLSRSGESEPAKIRFQWSNSLWYDAIPGIEGSEPLKIGSFEFNEVVTADAEGGFSVKKIILFAQVSYTLVVRGKVTNLGALANGG